MVMLDAPDFDNGSGLLVHVRTSIRYEYSYIESVAVKIGNDILEVGSWGDYFLNGVSAAEVPNKLSRFPVSYAAGYDQKEHALEIDLDGKSKIVVKSFKDMLSVMFLDATKSDFGNSVGLMGSFSDGSKIARDGKSVLNDVNAFAQEWQVLADEPKLFQTIRLPQHPEKCIMPEVKKTQRRLGASIAREAAEKACAHWKEDEKEACVYDVLATGDLETARAGAF